MLPTFWKTKTLFFERTVCMCTLQNHLRIFSVGTIISKLNVNVRKMWGEIFFFEINKRLFSKDRGISTKTKKNQKWIRANKVAY